jgi:hypothetical protein
MRGRAGRAKLPRTDGGPGSASKQGGLVAPGQSPPLQTGPGWARTTAGAAAGQVQRGHAGRRRARARGGGRLPQAQPAAVVVREGRAAARRGRTALGMCVRTVHVPGDVVSLWQRPLFTWHSMYWENWSCMRTRAGAAEAKLPRQASTQPFFGCMDTLMRSHEVCGMQSPCRAL